MPRTADELAELREHIRIFSQEIDALRPVLGDEMVHRLMQICDAGVILGNHAVPFAQMIGKVEGEREALQVTVKRLKAIEDRFYHARHHAIEAAKAYRLDYDKDEWAEAELIPDEAKEPEE